MSDATMQDAGSAAALPPQLTPKHLLAHAAIIALGLVMLYPVLWMVSSSFKPTQLMLTITQVPPASSTWTSSSARCAGSGAGAPKRPPRQTNLRNNKASDDR